MCPAFIQKDCSAWLDEIEADMPTVTFDVRSGAKLLTRVRVLEGERVVADGTGGLAVELDPGAHSLLALTGAAEAVLALEERVVLAATREQANRLANADHANLVRTTRAARAQLQAVEALRADRRLEELPGELREAAELRTRFPTESLRELARRTDPPASKAAMHRRLRRLEDLARA